MSSVAIPAAHLGRCYRSAFKRVAFHPAGMVVFDQLSIRTQIQLGAQPSQLDEFDPRPVVVPSQLASQLEALAGPQMAPLQLDSTADKGSTPTRSAIRLPSVG